MQADVFNQLDRDDVYVSTLPHTLLPGMGGVEDVSVRLETLVFMAADPPTPRRWTVMTPGGAYRMLSERAAKRALRMIYAQDIPVVITKREDFISKLGQLTQGETKA